MKNSLLGLSINLTGFINVFFPDAELGNIKPLYCSRIVTGVENIRKVLKYGDASSKFSRLVVEVISINLSWPYLPGFLWADKLET